MKRFSGVCLAVAFSLAGTSVVAVRYAAGLGTFTMTAMTLLFALPPLLALCARRLPGYLRGLGLRGWLMVGLQAVFGIFLFRMFLFVGLPRTSSAEAGILTGATPAATALLARLLLREPFGRGKACGIACTVLGVLLLQGLLMPGGGFSAAHLAGNLLVLLAALSESAFNVLSRVSALRPETRDAAAQTALVVAAAFLMSLVPAAFERPIPALLALPPAGWLALAWYGAVVTALGFSLLYKGLTHCEASMAAVFSGMMPLTALALSVLLLGERPGWLQWAGGGLVVAGMLLSGRAAAFKIPPPPAGGPPPLNQCPRH